MNVVKYIGKGHSHNDNFHYLCRTNEINPDDKRNFVVVNGTGMELEIAVFNVAGKYYAISNRCMHKGGPLSEGELKDGIVTCPWHGWKYSVINGKSPHKGGDSVDSYETRVLKGKLFVNPVPTSVGKRVSVPHTSYLNLKNSVNSYLKQKDKVTRISNKIHRKKTSSGYQLRT
jgi:nitrite reductase (NADH) small subunit